MIIANDLLTIEFFQNVFSGTRFDNTGIISQVRGKTPFGEEVTFCGQESFIPGFGSGGLGLASEFGIESPAGFDDAAPGELFLKIGVGWLRRPDDEHYRFSRPYEIVERGKLTTEMSNPGNGTQEIRTAWESGEHRGYACILKKSYALTGNRLEVTYNLKNSGDRNLWIYEYAHNFIAIGDTPVEQDSYTVTADDPSFNPPSRDGLVDVHHFPSYFTTYVAKACDRLHRWRIQRNSDGAGVRETVDFPVARFAVWAMPHVISPELFAEFDVAPEAEHTWHRTYTFGAEE